MMTISARKGEKECDIHMEYNLNHGPNNADMESKDHEMQLLLKLGLSHTHGLEAGDVRLHLDL